MTSKLEQAAAKNEWTKVELAGLTLVQSPLLSQQPNLTHAFTTRHGGESGPPMESFNLGRHIEDVAAREDAMKNREKLCQVLNLDFKRLVVPGQVHSARVVSADEESFAQVDAIATAEANRPILLHFADCVPIMLFDPLTPALAVVHAGWRGTAAKIVKNAVAFLQANHGSKPENIVAAIGPAIGTCCYPTGKDVAEQLASTVEEIDGLIIWGENPRPDLKAINAMQLMESGVKHIDVTNLCTACQPELFFSHRQSGGKTGRQGAIAGIDYIS